MPRQSARTARALPEALSTSPFGIVFISERVDNCQLYLMNADGSDQHQLLLSLPSCDAWPSPSPNGRLIVFGGSREGNTDIYVMSDDGSPPTRLTTDPRAARVVGHSDCDGARPAHMVVPL